MAQWWVSTRTATRTTHHHRQCSESSPAPLAHNLSVPTAGVLSLYPHSATPSCTRYVTQHKFSTEAPTAITKHPIALWPITMEGTTCCCVQTPASGSAPVVAPFEN